MTERPEGQKSPVVRNPYGSVDSNEMILRDVLASDRTFLAYVRTALTLVIGGVTLFRFFDLA